MARDARDMNARGVGARHRNFRLNAMKLQLRGILFRFSGPFCSFERIRVGKYSALAVIELFRCCDNTVGTKQFRHGKVGS